MNKVFGGLLLICVLISCDIRNTKHKSDVLAKNSGQQFADSTTVQMIDSVYNFGKVTDGAMVEYSYRFRNTGKNPLIVSSAFATAFLNLPCAR